MHILLAALGIAGAIYFFVIRARNAAEMTHELLDVADDIRAAARRFGFRRKKNVHPVDSTEEPGVLAALAAVSYLELDGLPNAEQQETLKTSLARAFQATAQEADEMVILARWLMGECQGPQPGLARAARRLYKTTGCEHLAQLMEVIEAITGENGLSPRQEDALGDIKAAFKVR